MSSTGSSATGPLSERQRQENGWEDESGRRASAAAPTLNASVRHDKPRLDASVTAPAPAPAMGILNGSRSSLPISGSAPTGRERLLATGANNGKAKAGGTGFLDLSDVENVISRLESQLGRPLASPQLRQ
eukprot:COSAG06_NODE_5796_length_3269_cov_1.839117_2_plen_130_part_00